MDIIRFTLGNPVKVAVGVILVCLFGVLALFQIPIQLTPNVDEPRVTVSTRWTGKSATEVAQEIVERQEEKLKGVPNLKKMTSESQEGQATVTLEFFVGTDKDVALRDVDEKLNQVTGYPPEAEKPEVVAADAALESPIAWLLLRADDGGDVSTRRDFVWDEVKPILERVSGLASVDVYGGREREVHVLLEPALLASRGLTLRDVEQALRGENVNTSAGTIRQGKREFVYRTVGEYTDVTEVENTIVAYRDGGPIYVRDLGKVISTYEKERGFVRSKSEPVLALPARRESGANVIEVMDGLKQQVDKVNAEILKPSGLELELSQVYDETVYINSAIALVRNNLFIGGILSVIVLLVFLRNLRATGIVALSIPISVIATILMVSLLGRNINVVMLSGMAFAVGMVVDSAIVVLENIYRHRQMGKNAFQAAYDGGTEVWGALLASTLTTMAVFLPVIFIEEEAGQLFRDIAIAIAAGVAMSLLVSVLVIPTVAARVLGQDTKGMKEYKPGRFAMLIGDLITTVNKSVLARLAVILLFVGVSLGGAYLLMPSTDYLPSGNRNLVFGMVIAEPGLSPDEYREMAYDVETFLRPYWTAEPGSEEAGQLPQVPMWLGPPGMGDPIMVDAPLVENFFFVNRGNVCFMGAISRDDDYVKPLESLLTTAIQQTSRSTGAIAFFQQASIFGGVGESGNSVEVELRGDDLKRVIAAGGQLFVTGRDDFPYIRPSPSNFDLLRPEIRVNPERVKAADVGLSVRDVGFIVETAVDGAYVGGFREKGDEIDMLLRFVNPQGDRLSQILDVPIYTPSGDVIPLLSVVDFEETGAPTQINRIEEMPGVSLAFTIPTGMALEEAMTRIQGMVDGLREQGRIDESILISMAGNADKLVQTRAAMFGMWTGFNTESIVAVLQSRGFLALLVVYLLMAALFESFLHPLAILFTVPLAAVGGFGGLWIVQMLSLMNPVTPIQQLDVVTMLGFVILLGIVVNNAILIVHQTLNNLNNGMDQEEALKQSVQTRIRPIFMTAFTSIGGMLPLALMTGAGSELYRGLAAVMVGGLMVATLFTIILIPVVYSFFLGARSFIMRSLGRDELGHRPEESVGVPASMSMRSEMPS